MRIALLLSLVAACSIPNKFAATGDGGPGGPGGNDDGGTSDGNGGPGSSDPGAPMLTITGSPPALGNQTSATFAYSVTPSDATVECQLDSAGYMPCPPPNITFSGLADGAHTFDIRASESGHTGNAPTYAFTVDTVPPVVAIGTPPPDPTNITSGTIAFSAGDAVTVLCGFDTPTLTPCTSPVSYGPLANGQHSFLVTGTDAAGNSASKSATWTVQTVAPMLAFTHQPNTFDNSTSFTFAFTTGTATQVTCNLDGAGATPCTNSFATGALAEKAHSFVVSGKDTAGNATSITAMWTSDFTPPALSAISGPASPTKSTTATFTWTVNEGTTTCKLDSGTPVACSSPYTITVGDATHNMLVTAIDAAGNTTPRSASSWLVDSTPPTIAGFTVHNDISCAPDEFTVSFSISDANLASISCSYAGLTYNPSTNPPCTATGLTSGYLGSTNKSFSVTATDVAGNVTTRTNSVTTSPILDDCGD